MILKNSLRGFAVLLLVFILMCMSPSALAAASGYPVGTYGGNVEISHKTLEDYPRDSERYPSQYTEISFECDSLVLGVYSDAGVSLTGEVTGKTVASPLFGDTHTLEYTFPIDVNGFAFSKREAGQTQTVQAPCNAVCTSTFSNNSRTKSSTKTHDGSITVTLTSTEHGFAGYAVFERLDMSDDYHALRLDFTFDLGIAGSDERQAANTDIDPFAQGGIPVGYDDGSGSSPAYVTEGIEGISEEPSDWGDESYDDTDSYNDYTDDDEGLPPVVIGGIAAGGLAAVAGMITAIVKAAAAKAAAKAAAEAASRAAMPDTLPYQPEVYDWRGNRIDEQARIRQESEAWEQELRETQSRIEAERARENAARAERERSQDEMLDKLIRMTERLNTSSKDVAWDMSKIIQKQIEAVDNGKTIDPEKFERMKEGFSDVFSGRIIGADEVYKAPTNSQLYIRACEDAFEEVCRNETVTGAAVRSTAFALSGGASEYVFQVGKGLYRMKDYVDSGGDSITEGASHAMWGAAKDYAVSKIADKAMKGTAKKYITPKVVKAKANLTQKAIHVRGKMLSSNTESGRYFEKTWNTGMGQLDKLTEKPRAQLERAARTIVKDQIKRYVKKPINGVVNKVL